MRLKTDFFFAETMSAGAHLQEQFSPRDFAEA